MGKAGSAAGRGNYQAGKIIWLRRKRREPAKFAGLVSAFTCDKNWQMLLKRTKHQADNLLGARTDKKV
jgi:hypothetical protein